MFNTFADIRSEEEEKEAGEGALAWTSLANANPLSLVPFILLDSIAQPILTHKP